MAEPRKSSGKSTAAAPGAPSRWRRVLLPLLMLAVAAGLLTAVFLLLRNALFTGNPRLALREVRVRTSGYWRNREKALCSRIGLTTGVNLFSVDLRTLRRRLEHIPCIASAEVRRVPPDTVEIRLEERIPRAVLGNPRSPFVVDEYCVIIPRTESMAGKEKLRLPVIVGIPLRGLKSGTVEPRLQNAVDLIMVILRGFPDIRVHQIMIGRTGSLELMLNYREKFPTYHVIMPAKNPGNAFRLSALQSAIIAARNRGDNRTEFDLSYEGQVVVREAVKK